MLLRQIAHDGLAQYSYLIGCQASGEAIVVDPNRSLEPYLEAAARAGLRIVAVTETHIHADFVSGAHDLVQRTGARLYLPDAGPPQWRYAANYLAEAAPLDDGDTITIGNVRLTALHTPGHTPEHMCLLVTDGAHADQPMGLLSGDCLFVGDVGRPDLLERSVGAAQTSEAMARELFRSLERLRELPEFVQVWPGHGAGSACGKALGAVPQSAIGYELRFNPAFHARDEATFVRDILAGQPAPPRYFAQMKRINQQGPPPTPVLPQRCAPADLAGALADGVQLIDARPADQYAAQHLAGTINIPAGASFLNWVGRLLAVERPIGVIADDSERVGQELALIGADSIAGMWEPAALTALQAAGAPLAVIVRRRAAALGDMVASGAATVIDIRDPEERAAGAIAGSIGIPLSELAVAAGALPAGPLIVHCQAGVRSPIGASLLTAAGRREVIDMVDGYEGWRR
jgi:hydroxyacylglutathione hydrolase